MSSVLSHSSHKLSKTTIQVSALQPQPPPDLILNEPIDDKRLLVKKLPRDCTCDELEMFLVRASALHILCWRIGLKPTTALLDFDSAPGIYQSYVLLDYNM